MKRLPLVVLGTVAILLFSTVTYSAAETAPSYVLQWGSQGLQITGLFSFPQDLAVDSAGNVYVSDYGNRRIQKFDNNGNFLHTWGIKGSGNGQFQAPAGIAIGQDYVYVVDNDLNRVQKFDTVGKYITQWGVKGQGAGQLMLPQGIAVDSHGDVYVADTGNSRIQKFTSDGKFLLSWGVSGLGDGQFLNPRGVAADTQGSVYVADSGNNRIQKFTADGVFVKTFDVSSGSSLKYPQGLEVDSSGNIYIADTGNNRISKIDRNGKSLANWGTQGTTNGNFNNPRDVALDSDGNVFVADSSNHRIQKFVYSTTTEPLTTTPLSPLKPNPNDKTPPAISAPSDVVSEANGPLSTVSIGQATATDASGIASLTNNAPEKFPLGITTVIWTATDASGNVAQATQRVTVRDTTSPVISAPPSVVVEAANPSSSINLGTPSTSDAIGVVSVTNDAPETFPLGDTIITWTATDSAGNSATTKQVVTVQDTTKPKIRAPADVIIEATSSANNVAILGDPTVTDNGEIQSITNDAPLAFPLGVTTITWAATDTAGNIAVDTQNVRIIDTTAPAITAPADVVFEAVSLTDNPIPIGDANATDIQEVTISNDAPIVFPLGETTVTWNATDSAGNSAVATQKVSVIDTTVPILILPADVISEATSPDHNIISLGEATAEDIIGISSITNNAPVDYTFGTTTVTWTAIDTAGNSISGNQTVTITDTTAPELKVPKDIVSEATDPALNIIQIGSATAFDIIDIESITNDAPDAFALGLTTITWTATDTSGNSVSTTQTVTIQDTTSPLVSAPADIIVEATSPTDNIISIGDATATDIIGIQSITNDAPATFPLGDTIVTWTTIDTHGNSATATQKITIVDKTAPAITVPPDVTFEALGPFANVIPIGDATADDIVGVTLITNDSPSAFPLGDTIVTWIAIDAAGNSATATQKITVVDTTPPTIVAPEPVQAEATSAAENIVTLGEATAADFVGVQSITNDAPAVFPVGETIVTWTATDTAGLTATATQTVTINDTTPPTLTIPDTITVEAASESQNIVNIGESTASDLVGIQSITNDAPDVFPLGMTTITWIATDVSGLVQSGTQIITVVDTTAPLITPPQDVITEAYSATDNPVKLGTATATDTIGIDSITSDAPSTFPFGETIVTWTATDTSGNTITGSQKVTIVDTTAPKIMAPSGVTFEATDPVNNMISIGTASATDIIGIDSITSDSPATFPFGETIVTWTATDTSGNSATDTQKVTVIDTTAPQLVLPANIVIDATALSNPVSIGAATATDIVDLTPQIQNDAPATFPLGDTIITWTATDKFGNTISQKQTVTVQACGKDVSLYNGITGGPTDDTLTGTNLADLIFGLAGDDIISGEKGDDCILGGDGEDIIFGNEGEDSISGNNGNDIIKGGSGNDNLHGNEGTDIIDGGDDHDTCNVGESASNDLIIKCEAGQL